MAAKRLVVCTTLFICLAPPLFGQNAVTVTPQNTARGATTLYDLSFSLPDTLPSDGAISVTFPAGFDLSNVNIAASGTIKGGLTTTVAGREVIIMRKGEGDAIAAGQRVDLKLAAITNPGNAAGSYTLAVSVQRDSARILQEIRTQQYRADEGRRNIEGSVSIVANP